PAVPAPPCPAGRVAAARRARHRPPADRGTRHRLPWRAGPDADPFGRQPAEGHGGALDVAARLAADPRRAIPGRRHRRKARHRGQAAGRCGGQGDAPVPYRTRRGAGDRRPHPRDVGTHHRRRAPKRRPGYGQAAGAGRRRRHTRRRLMADTVIRYGFLALLAALIVFFAIAAPGFASPQSAVFIFQSVAITGILALGVTATLVVGGFDLSIGSVATSAMMAAA